MLMKQTVTMTYILYTRLKVKKLKIFKPNVFGCLPSSGLKWVTVRAYIYILCNSQREKFGDIRNDLFVQTGAELLDH